MRAGGGAEICEPLASTAGADWREAVSALGRVLGGAHKYGSRVHLVLSDLWVRLDLTSAGSAGLSDDEMLLLGRAHLFQQFPDAGQDGLSIRIARQESRLLAAGMDSRLLASLKETAATAGLRLKRIEPLFAWANDRYRKELLGVSGWMILVEPGMITVSLLERGRLTSLHAQRCEAGEDQAGLLLLERQNALLAQPCLEVCVISVGTRGLRLPAPWRTLWQRSVIDFGNAPSAARVADLTAA